jgi:hypothetical protein
MSVLGQKMRQFMEQGLIHLLLGNGAQLWIEPDL